MSGDDAERNERNGRNMLAPETLAAQALGRIDEVTRAVVAPIHPSTTFERDADGLYRSGRGYTRPHNPSYDEPEELLARLEGGVDCLLLASGMAACTAVFQSLLPGDHVVAPRVMYWTLRKWLVESALSWGLEVEFLDTTDLDRLAAAMRPGKTRLVWLETPSNPTWDVTDIAAAAEIAHQARAWLVVDGTVATPVLTRPLELGADLVVHSATKYLNGHSDVLAGAIVAARTDALWQRIRVWRRDAGAVLGPFEAWLLLRGMRTLFLRVHRASQTALAIARHFANHPRLSQVLYPGLESHPGHAVASRQMSGGFGGMLSLRHAGGEAAAIDTAARVEVFKRATSLGGVESLIEHRASIEGPATPVPGDLLRLSIGVEHPDDLIADLERALDQSRPHAAAIDADVPASRPVPTSPKSRGFEDEVTARVAELLDERVRPLIVERGGDLTLHGVTAERVEIEVVGSPGSAVPIKACLEGMIRHYVLPNAEIVFVASGSSVAPAGSREDGGEALSPASRIEQVLREQVNPAVGAHGGHIRLVEFAENTAYLQLEGGCQGCAMADVTVRQGVEAILRDRVPELLAVVDRTDHAAGTRPYFETKKGSS